MYLSLSWRNIWRNKRRTLIAAASVFFAVILACLMRSGQIGSYSYMIHSSAKLFTGYLQVQGKGYWENRSLDRSIDLSDSLMAEIKTTSHVTSATPRLEGYTLVSHKMTTKVAQVIGIDPVEENKMTGLKTRLSEGEYLEPASEGVLLAAGLAEMLELSLGDSVILYGQGYHGQIAAAQLPVSGIVKLPFQEMNNGMVYLSLKQARELYLAYGRITSLAIMIDNISHLDQVLADIKRATPNEYAILTWDEMMPDLKQNIEVDNASGLIMIAILYIVIAFGIFGTVMMMISERHREFGILVSVGMKKQKLMLITTLETLFVSFVGVLSGIIGSIPLLYYFYYNPIRLGGEMASIYDSLGIEPIMTFSTEPGIFTGQSLVVFIIALFTAIYPLFFIWKLKPVDALKA